MHWQLATLALILLGFAAISNRIEGTSVTAPMVFTVVGIVVGARSLDLIDLEQRGEEIKLLTEATLTVVFFSDASRIDLRGLRGEAGALDRTSPCSGVCAAGKRATRTTASATSRDILTERPTRGS